MAHGRGFERRRHGRHQGADVALLYYSGDGIEAGGINYLLPVDANLESLAG
jgi:uncharacterized caspase-like protein